MNCVCEFKEQRGAVLIVALLVLLLLAMLAAAMSQTSQLQLHMAGNDEAKTAAWQQCLAALDAVLSNADNTPVTGGPGYRICATDDVDAGCDQASIAIDDSFQNAVGSLEFAVTRVGPAIARMPVADEDAASSSVFYRVAKFEINAAYDGTGQGLGRAAMVQGVLVRLAVPSG